MYWWRNVRETVLFAPAMNNLIRGGERLFVELGPHPALSSSINECLSEQKRKGAVLHSLKRKSNETTEMLSNLAALHNYGIEIDWKAVNQAAGEFVVQPTYPWNREQYWLESELGHHRRCSNEEHPLLGIRTDGVKPNFRVLPRSSPLSLILTITGSGIRSFSRLPAMVEIGLALCEALFPGEDYCVEELEAKKALFVSESKIPTVSRRLR